MLERIEVNSAVSFQVEDVIYMAYRVQPYPRKCVFARREREEKERKGGSTP